MCAPVRVCVHACVCVRPVSRCSAPSVCRRRHILTVHTNWPTYANTQPHTQAPEGEERGAGPGVLLPGNLGTLTQGQQDGLHVDEQPPAGQAEQQQDQDTPLQDHAHARKVPAPKRLRSGTPNHQSARGVQEQHRKWECFEWVKIWLFFSNLGHQCVARLPQTVPSGRHGAVDGLEGTGSEGYFGSRHGGVSHHILLLTAEALTGTLKDGKVRAAGWGRLSSGLITRRFLVRSPARPG